MPMNVDTMSRTELFILAAVATSLCVVFLIIGATGPQARDISTFSAYNCSTESPPPPVYNPEVCNGVKMGQGQTWVHQWQALDVLEEYWALAAFPFRSMNTSSLGQEFPVDISLKLEGRNSASQPWQVIASGVHGFTMTCPARSYECNGWWLFVLSFIKYEQLQASVTFEDSPGRQVITDVKFRQQTANIDFNNLRLGFHLTFLSIGVVTLCVYLFVMRNTQWASWTFEQKAAMALLLAQVGYNDPFFPFKFLVDTAAFPILGAILEALFQMVVVIFWVFFLDRYRRTEGAAWNPFSLSEIPKYVLVLSYFILTITLYSWVRSMEQSHPIPGEDLPVGVLVLFYLCAVDFAGIVLYVVILVLITAGPLQGRSRSYRRFMYVVAPSIVVMICVTLAIFTNSFGPYGRTLTEYMFFAGMWNLYVWIITYGAWPSSGRFADTNPGDPEAIEDGDTPSERIDFDNRDPSVDPLLDSAPLLGSGRKTIYATAPSTSTSTDTTDAPFSAVARSDLGADEGL